MADKKRAMAWLFELEDGLAAIPGDKGGLTYRGISHHYWPEWEGWNLLLGDTLQKIQRQAEDHHVELDQLACDFYTKHYWTPLRLYDSRVPDAVAAELLECAVLTTPAEAVRILQEVLNGLNVDASRWEELEVDGRMGPATLDVLGIASRRYAQAIAIWVNTLQGRELWARKRELFNAGWARRLRLP